MTEPGSAPHLDTTAVITVRTGAEFNKLLQNACEQRGWIAQFSDYQAYLSRDRRAALSSLRGVSAYVVFIDFDHDLAQALETVEYLNGALSVHQSLIAVSKHQVPATMLAAMRAGCKDFLCMENGSAALIDILEQMETRTEVVPRNHVREASVLSFFGAKGGVGTTAIAVHLALALRQVSNKRVLLIDHHAELGDVCLYLGVDGARAHLAECIRSVGRLDSELLRGCIVRHSSGLELLSSPDSCQESRPLDPEAVVRTLDFLRTEYDYVLLDCANAAAEDSEPILAASSTVYLVTTPEVSALRNLSRLMEVLTPTESCREKLRVVLNRSDAAEALDAAQVEAALKLSVSVQLASAAVEMTSACNLGKPLSAESRHPLAAQFTRWAGSLAGVSVKAAAAKKAKPFFSVFQQKRLPQTPQASAQPATGRS